MMKVASYNVHYWTDDNEVFAFQRQVAMIKAQNADVIGLQEVKFHPQGKKPTKKQYQPGISVDDFKASFQDMYPHMLYFNTSDYRSIVGDWYDDGDFCGNMIMSKFPIGQTDVIPFVNGVHESYDYGTGKFYKGRPILSEPRFAAVAEIKANGTPFTFITTHLENWDWNGAVMPAPEEFDKYRWSNIHDDKTLNRLVAALYVSSKHYEDNKKPHMIKKNEFKELVNYVKQLSGPVIVTGDFNDHRLLWNNIGQHVGSGIDKIIVKNASIDMRNYVEVEKNENEKNHNKLANPSDHPFVSATVTLGNAEFPSKRRRSRAETSLWRSEEMLIRFTE